MLELCPQHEFCYRGLLLDLPAADVEVFPIAALRRCLTQKGSVLGLNRCQIAPLIKAVFSGKASQFGQGLRVDPVKERILVPLAPIQPLKALPRLQFVVLMFVPPVLFHPQFTGEY